MAHRLLSSQLPRLPRREQEQALVSEYQTLTAVERQGRLSRTQAERLHEVTADLDRLEASDPVEQEADRRLQETSDKLDEMLALLRSLPRRDVGQWSSGRTPPG